jgi:hypothetical protein
LETERLLLFVEGKRTEPLSASTHWYPERNQLVRNLEVVGELARGCAAAVLLVSEEPLAELTQETRAASTPHLDVLARKQLSRRYLGQTTWAELTPRPVLNAGLIDVFTIALSPVLFGSGIRLFEGVDAGRVALEPIRAEPTQRVTHLTYAVRER